MASEDSQDVPEVNVEQPDSVPFPSISTTPKPEEGKVPMLSTSPDSNASALTSSDKLSALPTPRSPHSPRFRQSLDASRSWPNLTGSQGMANMDALGMSPSLNAASALWGESVGPERIRATASEGSVEGERGRRSLDGDRSFPTMHSVKHAFQRLHRGSDPASPPVGVRASEHRRDTADSASQSRSRAASPLRILQQWSSGLHRTYTHHDDTDPFVPVNPFRSDFTFRLPNFSFFKSPYFTKASPSSDNEELPVFNVTTAETTHHGTTNVDSRRRDDGFGNLDRLRRRLHYIKDYLTETSISLLLVIYLHLLLRLPSMYFSRVSRIFEDAEISKPEIRRMINSCKGGSRIMAHNNRNATANAASSAQNQAQAQAQATRSQPNLSNQTRPNSRTERERERPANTSFAANLAAAGLGIASPFGGGQSHSHSQPQIQTQTQTHLSPAAASLVDIVHGMDVDVDAVPMLPLPEEWSAQLVSPALMRFKMSWEGFVDSLMKEWKTLNVVSALLLSAILTTFQVPDASTDPLTRTAALLSLISAIMSISYGCMYIVRFGAMRSMYRASRWAEEAQKTKTILWWNVWILLAMPAVWMSWSMIFFIISIICYVWRTGSITDPPERDGLSPRAALGPRIAVTGLFVIGMIYFFLIVKTLRSYGSERPSLSSSSHRHGHGHGHDRGSGGGGGGGEAPGHSTRRDGTGGWNSTQGRGYRAEPYDANANASVWERRGRERERSSSTARGHRMRRSESLSRDHQHHHHHHHGNRLDFRERVHSLGHSYSHGGHGHGHGHEQGHSRKLFGFGTLMGHGHRDGRAQVPAQAEGSRSISSDWVDLEAEMDLEKGLPSEKVTDGGRDEKG